MECPNCGHSQDDTRECSKCGIIFKKYQLRQEKIAAEKTDPASLAAQPPLRRSFPGWLKAALAIAALAAGAMHFQQEKTVAPPSGPGSGPLPAQTQPAQQSHQNQTLPATSPNHAPDRDYRSMDGIAGQLASKFPANNGLEWARNSTVLISTPWGSGTGFFVSGSGQILTNRHVVEFDAEKLKTLQTQIDRFEAELEKALRNISYLETQLAKITNQEMRGQVAEEIERRRQEHKKYSEQHAKAQKHLESIARSSWATDLKVTLIDGTEFPAESLRVSKNNDLALLSINCYNAPFLSPQSPTPQMSQGQKIFAIGNPAGLRHTITSGIISGWREYKGTPLIQIDAAINKGNSGGPLVDETGKVLGVNTMTLSETQGIGFAIPFSEAQKEFALILPEN